MALEYGGNVCISILCLGLTRSKMAIDEAHRSIIEDKSNYQGTLSRSARLITILQSAHLVAILPAHTTLDIHSTKTADALTQGSFHKYAREEADHSSSVEWIVELSTGYELVHTLFQMIFPISILMAHVLMAWFGVLLLGFVLLGEETFYGGLAKYSLLACTTLTGYESLVLKINELLKPKDNDIRITAASKKILEESSIVVLLSQVRWGRCARIPSHH